MFDYLIYNQLKKYSKANKCFHVPGHKARGDFHSKFPVAGIDVTELSYSDNLFCPAGVIDGAQRDLAKIVGAEKSYILTGGSTSGILAMMYVASKCGEKFIVPRNCHESVWNACRLFHIEPVIVQGQSKDGILLPPDPAEIETLLENDVRIGGMIVTSPDYYGNIAPLGKYAEILNKFNRLFLVDGAHGAHLAFEPEKRGYAGVYADLWVDGAHKSLPVLTQGALLNAKNSSLIPVVEEALGIFRTTSPSYPVMASVEYGYKYLYNNPKYIEQAKLALQSLKEKIAPAEIYPSDDWTKLVLDFAPVRVSADKMAEALEKKGIYCELSDGRHILFYISPAVTASDITALANTVVGIIKSKKLEGTYRMRHDVPASARTYSFRYAHEKPREYIELEKAEGRMCAENCGITPPCIPVLVAGEVVSKAHIELLSGAKSTFGLKDGKIAVVKR